MMNAGNPGYAYPDFKPFTPREIEQHITLYFLQWIAPVPQANMRFKSQRDDPIAGNDLVARVFGKNGGRRHKHFKCFFTLTNPLKVPPPRSENPNYKVYTLLRHMQIVCAEAWDPGVDFSGDEQTIGFQGAHADKLRINYKAEGDGFQTGALCENGYTFAFYFRNQPAPSKYLKQGLSPLHSRIMGLFDVLRHKYHRVQFDNLYLSAKFCRASWNHPKKVLVAGVTRKGGRGIPSCVKQEELVNKKEIMKARGTVKAAILKGDGDCPNLVAVSVYDTKPVHFLSMKCDSIKWVVKTKLVYCNETGRREPMKFLRLNVNNDYNQDMGHVDVSDQLRNQYRFDHWMRKRKWWWSFWFWGMGVLKVNAYVCYVDFMKEQGVPQQQILTHYEFRKQIALAWLDADQYWPDKYQYKKRKDPPTATDATVRPTRAATLQATIESSRPGRVCDKSLDGLHGKLRCRVDTSVSHFPVRLKSRQVYCSLHRWATSGDMKYRGGITKCSHCNVALCHECFTIFHSEQNIVPQKETLGQRFRRQKKEVS